MTQINFDFGKPSEVHARRRRRRRPPRGPAHADERPRAGQLYHARTGHQQRAWRRVRSVRVGTGQRLVRQTVEAIRWKSPKTKVDKLHCAVFEQAEKTETADAWIEANRQMFADRDLIVLQIGDNANNATCRAVFAGSLPRLVRAMRSASPGARIILLGVWYAHADTIKAPPDTASSCGAKLVRIDDLAVSANMGVKGQAITYADGSSVTAMDNWITHPGDRGMRLIADRLVAALDM